MSEAPRPDDLNKHERELADLLMTAMQAAFPDTETELLIVEEAGDASQADDPFLTEAEIRERGWAIDVPFDSGGPQEIRYADGRTLTEAFPDLLQD